MGVLLIAAFVCRGGVVIPSYAAAPVQLAGLDFSGLARQLIDQTIDQIKKQQSAKNQPQSTPTNSNNSQIPQQAQQASHTIPSTRNQNTTSSMLLPSPDLGSVRIYQLPANTGWRDTGIDIANGQSISIMADGTVTVESNSPYGTPAGFVARAGIGNTIYGKLQPQSFEGRINASGTPFEMGTSHSPFGNTLTGTNFVASTSGRLFLTINNNFFGNNSAEWYVTVSGGNLASQPTQNPGQPITSNGNRSLPASFQLPANVEWFDTGIDLTNGQTVTITANGTVTVGALIPANNVETPAGKPELAGTGRPGGPLVAQGLAPWSLVGRIGSSGKPFEIGTSTTFTASDSGRLYLSVNDNYFGDNSGSWNVTVTGGTSSSQPTQDSSKPVPPSSGLSNPFQSTDWKSSDSSSGMSLETKTIPDASVVGLVDISVFVANNSGLYWVLSQDNLSQFETALDTQLSSQGINLKNAESVAMVSKRKLVDPTTVNKAISLIGVQTLPESISTASDAVTTAPNLLEAGGLYYIAEYFPGDPTTIFQNIATGYFNEINSCIYLADQTSLGTILTTASKNELNPAYVIQPGQALQVEISRVQYAGKAQTMFVTAPFNFYQLSSSVTTSGGVPRSVILNLSVKFNANTTQQTASISTSGSSPLISSVSPILPQATQTITISGSGFGTQNAFNGTSKYLKIHDNTANWDAGYSGDWINVNVIQWTDTQIVIKGFTGAYGLSEWKLNTRDKLTISVWNAQTGSGPVTFNATVNSNQ
jgi:hypothetical protein